MIKKNVAVQLHTVIDDQGDKEMSVVKQKGKYFQKGNLEVVTFTDQIEDIGTIKNQISIHPDQVTVKRAGAISMNQQFMEGKKSECLYRHPYGMFAMEIETHHVSAEYKDENKTKEIVIEYDVFMNEESPRSHHLTLTITEERDG
ncbi:MAG TPA: DUF1934 domain-containing protein [Pseudogracilibacillus sp.]|nr:DUF1934 domain-containing protein [Pseudogracilibacillus sp.]